MLPGSWFSRMRRHARRVIPFGIAACLPVSGPVLPLESRGPSFAGVWVGVLAVDGGKTLPIGLDIRLDSAGTLEVLVTETTVEGSRVEKVVTSADTIGFVETSPGWDTRFRLHLTANHDSLLGDATVTLASGQLPPFGGPVRLARKP